MAIKKIVIDDRTQVKPLDGNKIQLDLVAFPLNQENQKEPDVELKIFVNNQLLQNLMSDLQGNIKESLIIHGNSEEIVIKLQDIKSGTVSNIKTLMLGGKKEEKNDNSSETAKIIAQLKINPNGIYNIPERAKDDGEIVKYALEQDGMLLQYASENLKNDKKTIKIALDQNSNAFVYASDILKTDENFVIECLSKFGETIVNQLPNYIRNVSKVKMWIDTYYVKKNELINRRQEISNGLQEMIGLDSDRFHKKGYIEQYKKTLDDLDILIPLQEEITKLNKKRGELNNQLCGFVNKYTNIFNANSVNRQRQEIQSKFDICCADINIIIKKMEKIPTYGQLYGNKMSVRKERNSRELLQAEKELQIIINKINGIKSKIGNVDEKELTRLDEKIAKLHTTIHIT